MSHPGQYTSAVKIHNWHENQILNNAKTQQLQHAITTNTLLSSHRTTLLNHTLQPTHLTHTQTGQIYSGDNIMLYNHSTTGVLSIDINEPVHIATNNPNTKSYTVSTSTLTPAHVLRNTFVIEAVNDKSVSNIDISQPIQYHQKFRLVCHADLHSQHTLYLASITKSHLNHSAISKQQCVYMTADGSDYNTVWMFELADRAYRYEAETTPVHTTQACLIVHCATQQPLYSAVPYTALNTYGVEHEVTAQYATVAGKTHQLMREQLGKTSVEASNRQQLIQNVWSILVDTNDKSADGAVEEKTQ